MSFLSGKSARTVFFVVVLSGAGLWALHAMSAKAEPSRPEDDSPCAEGRALFAGKLAYLEARVAPKPDQEGAWRTFSNSMLSSAADADRACIEAHEHPRGADAGERLERMAKRAAATQAMFDEMAQAYIAVAPSLTTAQRDILSRNIVPRPFPGPLPPPPGRQAPPRPQDMAFDCGLGGAGPQGLPPL